MRGFGKSGNPYYTHGVVVTTYPKPEGEIRLSMGASTYLQVLRVLPAFC
jgi:hypothetical protein